MAKASEAAKVESKELTVDLSGFGLEGMSSRDMVIPKILLTQKMSKAVDDSGAAEGDLIDSIEGINFGKSVTGCVFHVGKVWWVYEDDTKEKFLKSEPVTAENEDASFEYRDLVYQFSILVDGNPYGLSMKGTSRQTARRLISLFTKKGGTAGVIITLTGKKDKNDKGSYMVWDFKVERDSTIEEIKEAREWFESIKRGAVKHSEEVAAPQTTGNSDGLPF